MEEDLDGEFDLDATEVGPMLTAMRKTETAEPGAGAGGVAEGDPAASSDSPGSNSSSRRIYSSSSNSSSRISSTSSNSTSSRIPSTSSNRTSTSRGDIPTLAGREAHRQRWDGKIPALQGGRTRS